MTNYPTQLDEIDQWLFDSFGIVAGACSSTENLRYNTARMVVEALWPKCKDSLHIQETCKENGDSFTDETESKKVELRNNSATTSQKLDETPGTHLNYDEYIRCLDAADEYYESRDKDVYCHETSFRWGFEAGAEWQKEQDHYACRQCEKAYDNIFFKGIMHAIKIMKEEAIEGTVCGRVIDHINIRFAEGVGKHLTPKNISHIPADISKYNINDKVWVYIFKEK